MGVHGLWQLLHPSGRAVTLESLEGKVLAVDVSLWLHQTMKGMRDKDGNPLPNAHLQGLFSRVCKLLFYRIKPVFVFDGDVPVLKKQTLIGRRERKAQAEREGQEIAQKLLRNLVKSEAVKNALGDTSKLPVRVPGVRKGGSNRGEKDIFELPPLHETDDIRLRMNAEAWEQEFEQQENWIKEGLKVLSDVRPDSEEFKSLPIEIQHEVLNDMKERQKYHSLRQMTQMPEDSDNFSAYQLKKLMKQCNLTTEIESVRKIMAKKTVNDLELERDEKYTGDEVEARRIVSEDASHYILIKGMSKKKQEEHADRYELESKIKKEKEDDLTKFKGALSHTLPQSDNKAEREKLSTSSVGTKRSFIATKASGSRSKQAKRPRQARMLGGKGSVTPSASVDGSSCFDNTESFRTVKAGEVDNDEEKDLESVEEMSSEDEGFIEVAFDPTQMMEEDELFPASIFTPATETEKEKEHSIVKVPTVSSNILSVKSSQMNDSIKAASVTTSKEETKSTESFENREGSKAVRRNNGSVTHVNEECSSLPISLNAEKRQTVLNDILSQLKKKKEEILLQGDTEEILKGDPLELSENLSSGLKEYNEIDKEACVNSPIEIGHSGDGDSKKSRCLSCDEDRRVDPKCGNNPKLHHIDSGSEDEDLKLAIQLSLQTTEAELETCEKKIEEDTEQSDASLTHRNNSDERSRQSESNEDDDSETMENTLHHSETDDIERQSMEEEERFGNIEKGKELSKAGYSICGSSSTAGKFLLPMSEGSNGERLQPEDFEIDTPFTIHNQCVAEDLTGELEAERNALLLEQGKQARFAKSLTEQVTLEAQELLRLFGIPYIVSPMEAEAQCAYLDVTEQTQGTITDDSDIWLFGGRRMYKNFFNQNKHVEFFSIDSIVSHFGLERQQLINIALLCGSDYTEGIESVGPVRALEILGEFPGDGLNGLRDFRNWWERARKYPLLKEASKIKSRLRDLSVIKGFPSQAVVDAYMSPVVDESKESFSWGQPDLDLLRQFTKLKFGWSREKSDQSLEPMMKQLMKRQTQGRIYAYFQQDTFIPAPTVKSSRLEKALLRVQEGKHIQAEEEEDEEKPQKTATNKRKNVGKNIKQGREREEEYGTNLPKINVKKRKKEQLELNNKRKQIDNNITEVSNEKEELESLLMKVKEEVDLESMNQSKDDTLPSVSLEREVGGVKSASHITQTKKKVKGKENQNTREKHSLPNLTLETKRRSARSQKRPPKKSAFSRSSICLSASSSDSEFSDESKSLKSENPETVKWQKNPTMNVKPSESGQVQGSKTPESVKGTSSDKKTQREKADASDLLPKNDSSLTVRKTSVSSPIHNKMKEDLNFEEKSSHRNVPLPVRNTSKKQTREKERQESVDKKKTKPVKKSPSNSGGNSQPDAQMSQVAKGKLNTCGKVQVSKEADSRGLKSVKIERDLKSKRLIDSKEKFELIEEAEKETSPVQSSCPEGEELEEGQTLSKQVVKNPDVSLINAQTLKATLMYLNQRSREKKQLLHSLKGGHCLNAVERRMEEEEKRERTTALIQAKKEQSGVKKLENIMGPKQDVSFEDMLGGLDAEIVKSRPGKSKSRLSHKGKTTQKYEKVEGQSQFFPRIEKQKHERQLTKDLEKTVGAAKRQMRMRSMSSDSSSSVDIGSKQVNEKDQEEETNVEIDFEVKDQRSERSRHFDQPIRGSRKSEQSTIGQEDHDPQASDKFQYQMYHMNDSRSVKSHGYVPCQEPPEKIRGLAIAGKGKGIGKNRNGRKAGDSARPENRVKKNHAGIQVSKGVTTDQIQAYAHISADDLGSDFSDNEF